MPVLSWLALPLPLALAGVLTLDAGTAERWPPCGAWRLPVGDPYAVSDQRPSEPGPYFLLRSVEWDGRRASHQGADLGNGRSGGVVRAAAAGLVVKTADRGHHGGYGTHVVIAHRLPEGVLVYSVYSHLLRGSVRVREGEGVTAGHAIARVGATGRASTPHLHFEVRLARDPAERWEHARIEDPLAWVDERLPAHRADSTGAESYLEWGECAALVSPGVRADDRLTREVWWRMLAAAARGPVLDPALEAGALRDSLIGVGVLPEQDEEHRPGRPTSWDDVERDLRRLRALGVRVGPAPLERARHRERLDEAFGTATPFAERSTLEDRDGRPTVLEALLLLAELGQRDEPEARPAKGKSGRGNRRARTKGSVTPRP
ncbi:MAG: M23 family metallopeptidase [bacterium]